MKNKTLDSLLVIIISYVINFFGRNDAKVETPVLWPPHTKSWLIGKDSDAGRDWGQKEKRTEDEMAGWHHWLNGHESVWTAGVGDGQGGLACYNSWGRKESDTTERLNWTELIFSYIFYCCDKPLSVYWTFAVPWSFLFLFSFFFLFLFSFLII